MPSPPTPPSSPSPPSGPSRQTGQALQPRGRPADAAGKRNAQLPHERDESSDPEAPAGSEPSQRAVAEQARRDVRQGLQDTDRGPVTERVYEGLKRRER
jgi:hypothetical protein